jgi:hypothetical protein
MIRRNYEASGHCSTATGKPLDYMVLLRGVEPPTSPTAGVFGLQTGENHAISIRCCVNP